MTLQNACTNHSQDDRKGPGEAQLSKAYRLSGKHGQSGLMLIGTFCKIYCATRLFQLFAKEAPILPGDLVVIGPRL